MSLIGIILRWGFLIWELIFIYCGLFVLILVVFVLFLLSLRFGQISPLAFFRWFTATSDRNAESCNRMPSNYCLSKLLSIAPRFWPSKPLAGLGRIWNRYLLTITFSFNDIYYLLQLLSRIGVETIYRICHDCVMFLFKKVSHSFLSEIVGIVPHKEIVLGGNREWSWWTCPLGASKGVTWELKNDFRSFGICF